MGPLNVVNNVRRTWKITSQRSSLWDSSFVCWGRERTNEGEHGDIIKRFIEIGWVYTLT